MIGVQVAATEQLYGAGYKVQHQAGSFDGWMIVGNDVCKNKSDLMK